LWLCKAWKTGLDLQSASNVIGIEVQT